MFHLLSASFGNTTTMLNLTVLFLTLYYVPETKIAEFTNSVDPDEVAHNNELPHLDLQRLPSSL